MKNLSANMDELMPILEIQLSSGATPRLGITGTSMQPMLRNAKDSVLLSLVKDLKKNHIILYKRANGKFVLHRIVGVTDGGYLCCGDNQWQKETVSAPQVLAMVCGFYRGDKERTLNSPAYRFYVNLLPLRRLYCRTRDALFRH